MPFDLNNLKTIIRDTLRVYLNPNNLVQDTDVALSDNISVYSLSQSFIPYSKCYSTTSPYRYTIDASIMLKRTGTPDGDLIVSLQSSTSGYPSGVTISSYTIDVADVNTTFDVHSVSLKLTSMLGSDTEYQYVITPASSASTINFYTTTKNSTATYMVGNLYKYNGTSWSSETGSMYFDVNTPQWIYQNSPRDDINRYSFRRLAIELTSRTSEQRWINTEFADYTVDCNVVCYSNYPEELDEILSYVDRAIFKERTKFTNVRRIDPGNMTPVSVIRQNLFTRAITYRMLYRMNAV